MRHDAQQQNRPDIMSLLQHEDMFGDLEPLIVDQSLLTSMLANEDGIQKQKDGTVVVRVTPQMP